MTTYRPATYTETARTRQDITFDSVDSKGRVLGCTVVLTEDDITTVTGGYSIAADSTPDGHYFHAYVQATREGKSFGASQHGERFATSEARAAYVEKRIEASRKAAAKKAA